MSEIKKYTDIIRLGHTSTEGVLKLGDYINISEKLDGSNASFTLNSENKIDRFSRKIKLSENETLRGFYQWVENNIKPELLNPKYRYYGEFLASHKISYRPEFYNQFYLFNVYDEELEEYLSDEIMRSEAAIEEIKQDKDFNKYHPNFDFSNEEEVNELLEEWDYKSYENYGNDYEYFSKTYKTKHDDEIIAFGYYGSDR